MTFVVLMSFVTRSCHDSWHACIGLQDVRCDVCGPLLACPTLWVSTSSSCMIFFRVSLSFCHCRCCLCCYWCCCCFAVAGCCCCCCCLCCVLLLAVLWPVIPFFCSCIVPLSSLCLCASSRNNTFWYFFCYHAEHFTHVLLCLRASVFACDGFSGGCAS